MPDTLLRHEISIRLTGDVSNTSVETVTTTAGSTTITTTVEAHSHKTVKKISVGVISIDGEEFELKFKVVDNRATGLDITEEFSGPTFSQAVSQKKITIPGNMVMCNDDKTTCFEGFGVIRRESSITESGGNRITFATDELEAELIGDDGLFNLSLSKLQRIVEPNIRPFEGTVGTAFTINDPFGRLVPSAVVVFTFPGDDVCTQGTIVDDLTVSGDGTTASGTVPASLSAEKHGVTVHDADQCTASILLLQFVVT